MTAGLAAAVVLMLGASAAAGADLGRLFFTPAQRATLDNARMLNIRSEVGSENAQAAPVPQNVSVNGVVRRSDGKSTVWINNRALSAPQTGGINVSTGKTGDRVKLTVPESGRSVDLKVGQTVEIASGTIEENYARRTAPKPAAKAALGAEDNAPAAATVPPSAGLPQVKSEAVPGKRLPRAGVRDVEDQNERGQPPQTEPGIPRAATPSTSRRSLY
jgi:hypothetical protein